MIEKSVIRNCFSFMEGIFLFDDYIYIRVKQTCFLKFIFYLMNHSMTRVKQLIDLFCVDKIGRKLRFDIYYVLLSICREERVVINVGVETFNYTITEMFQSGKWLEREVWDMYGIFFEGNEDLRRILTDYGFEGFPLRKDFPLTGYKEVRYDDIKKRVVLEKSEMSQEVRLFKFNNPWIV